VPYIGERARSRAASYGVLFPVPSGVRRALLLPMPWSGYVEPPERPLNAGPLARAGNGTNARDGTVVAGGHRHEGSSGQ
jgi:hypothetical protein